MLSILSRNVQKLVRFQSQIPSMMKAVTIPEFGGPDVMKMDTIETPMPKPDEVLIKVAAAGVNRPDCVQRAGMYPAPPGASKIPGLEVAGHIAAVGENVTHWNVGDECCALLSGGGYAEYCVADSPLVLPVPKGFSLDEAAAIPETFFTVWYNIFMRGNLKEGERLLIQGGTGGIGTTALQLGKAFGAETYTTVGGPDKVEYCMNELGVEAAFDFNNGDWEKELKVATKKEGVDVILDVVGGDYLQKNVNSLRMDGRLVCIGFLKGPKSTINMTRVMLKRLSLTGSTLRSQSVESKTKIAEELREKVWPLLDEGIVRPHLFKSFSLLENGAVDAHACMEAGEQIGKLILKN
eukprot:TRINITY_DN774143_c0_g1_i1.p1 TRINITY_DN774143_c0_g1~~TRINITY_DN774143_c0_g1_i1.p1  ORF type:complete len:351 (-),score=136.88 TRINITY_DN774143_c0_g1_i1:256-1308(-)